MKNLIGVLLDWIKNYGERAVIVAVSIAIVLMIVFSFTSCSVGKVVSGIRKTSITVVDSQKYNKKIKMPKTAELP